MPVVFGEIAMSFWIRENASQNFWKGNSSSRIRVIIFRSLRISTSFQVYKPYRKQKNDIPSFWLILYFLVGCCCITVASSRTDYLLSAFCLLLLSDVHENAKICLRSQAIIFSKTTLHYKYITLTAVFRLSGGTKMFGSKMSVERSSYRSKAEAQKKF